MPDADRTRQRSAGPFLVQVKYASGVIADAPPDGWITAAASAERDMAVRRAADVYRTLPAPDGSLPQQVRVRSEAELRRDGGDEAVARAYRDVLTLAEAGGEGFGRNGSPDATSNGHGAGRARDGLGSARPRSR